MNDIIARIVQWNSARYAQEISNELTAELLFEESAEFNDARSGREVDQLDALCDVVYVAVGAMWKMGLTTSEIEQAMSVVCDSNDSKSAAKSLSHIKSSIIKGVDFIPPEPRLQEILNGRS